MFLYIGLEPRDGRFKADMKCSPERSAELREQYAGITHGTHTKGLMWNSVYLDSDVPDKLICELILHSVDEVIKKLPKKKQEEYKMNKLK